MTGIFIATPMFGGQCYGSFAASRDFLTVELMRRGYDVTIWGKTDSLVTRARNDCVYDFRQSGADLFLFIDADIEFEPDDVLALLSADKDVVCGPYQRKEIAWANVVAAAKAGLADEDPAFLETVANDFIFVPAHPEIPSALDEPLEVKEAGTGFMLIKRAVFDRLDAIAERYSDHHKRDLVAFFDTKIVENRYLSEDYNFCRLVRQSGMQVWLLPHLKLKHHGQYRYSGTLEGLSQLQAVTTARIISP